MTDDEQRQVHALLDETRSLIDQVKQIRARHRAMRYFGLFDPGWPRLLCEIGQAWAMVNKAEQLVHQINRLMGKTGRVRWLGMGRTGWLCVQWSNGVYNGYLAFAYIAQERYVLAAMAGLCVLVTAAWRLPPAD